MQQSSPGTVKLPLVNRVKDKNPDPPAGKGDNSSYGTKGLLRSDHLIDSGRLNESTAQRLAARDLLHKESVRMKARHEHSAGIAIQASADRATGSLPGATRSPPQIPKHGGGGHKAVPVLIMKPHERSWQI